MGNKTQDLSYSPSLTRPGQYIVIEWERLRDFGGCINPRMVCYAVVDDFGNLVRVA